MEETYERQLARLLARLPDGPAIVALVPTIPLDEAAALASDVAQTIGASRGGHTILISFESTASALDHEIGVEGGAGLADVLSKSATMTQVAAHGRARRFIYVPAGSSSVTGEALLRSDAWRLLSANAVRRGGTILAFVPPDVFGAVHEGRSEGGGRRFDALIWLGPARGPGEGVRRAAITSGAADLGSVRPPVGPERAKISGGSAVRGFVPGQPNAAPGPGAGGIEGSTPEPPRPVGLPTPGPRAESRPVLIDRGRRSRRRAARRRRHRIAGAAIGLILAGTAGAYFMFAPTTGEPDRGAAFASPDSASRSDSASRPDTVSTSDSSSVGVPSTGDVGSHR